MQACHAMLALPAAMARWAALQPRGELLPPPGARAHDEVGILQELSDLLPLVLRRCKAVAAELCGVAPPAALLPAMPTVTPTRPLKCTAFVLASFWWHFAISGYPGPQDTSSQARAHSVPQHAARSTPCCRAVRPSSPETKFYGR